MSENENVPSSSEKLSLMVEKLLESYMSLKEKVVRLENEIKEKNEKISELEEKLVERDLEEEDLISKIENALNNNGI